jgi:hypothetical protein
MSQNSDGQMSLGYVKQNPSRRVRAKHDHYPNLPAARPMHRLLPVAWVVEYDSREYGLALGASSWVH